METGVKDSWRSRRRWRDGDGEMEMEEQEEMFKLDLYSRLKLLETRREVMWAVDPKRITSLH